MSFFFFKQKTAYEIMPSLVGSEMCIRDRSIGACGADGPNSSASRMPSQGSAGTGAWNRRGPSGGLANGMPRKTAMPFSRCPLTRPALVETSGSAGAMEATSRYVDGALRSCIYDFRLFSWIKHDHGNRARRRRYLVLLESGEQFLLLGPYHLAFGRLGDARRDAHGLGADLDRCVRVRDHVVVPGRIVGCARLGPEDREALPYRLIGERRDPLGPCACAGMVQQKDVRASERAAHLAAVGTELGDDLAVEISRLCHAP